MGNTIHQKMASRNIKHQLNKENLSLPQVIEAMEKEYIITALNKVNWHRENAASLLGITRKMLGDRINKYQLKK